LQEEVRKLPTPQARDFRTGTTKHWERENGTRNLNDFCASLENNGTGLLNPPWVEWLMAWPIGWTALLPLETDKFQSWLQQHGEFSVTE
jgi:DNA (cytosine-5)-methyltransferase 1